MNPWRITRRSKNCCGQGVAGGGVLVKGEDSAGGDEGSVTLTVRGQNAVVCMGHLLVAVGAYVGRAAGGGYWPAARVKSVSE